MPGPNPEQLTADPRVTVRRAGPPDPAGRAVIYWMQRAQRATDNPALETAIAAANAIGKPVVVYFGLVAGVAGANLRHYQFLVEGLRDVADDLAQRGIAFVVRKSPDHDFMRFCTGVRPALVIGDENPLRAAERTKRRTAARLDVPFWTVDADVIVPSRLLQKEQYAARTIRPRIHSQLPHFLRPIRRHVPRHTWTPPRRLQTLHPDLILLEGFPVDRSVSPVATCRGGSHTAAGVLRRFVAERLSGYVEHRNHPERDATSQLSPYLHFGHIGPHTVALAVRDADAPARDREAFLDELIIRRELAVNFVRYNPVYDRLSSAEPWARRTLAAHRIDPRLHRYTPRQLEQAETHDVLWNAAQRQMVCTGWMHGYLRMYWAKKILEWSESPEAAYEIAVTLNDRYELDGRDPNGYAGVAWHRRQTRSRLGPGAAHLRHGPLHVVRQYITEVRQQGVQRADAGAGRGAQHMSAAEQSTHGRPSTDVESPPDAAIRIGVATCLLGEHARFDGGGHKRDPFLVETFGRYVEWVPVCPEVEAGLGVPRESMRLRKFEDGVRLVTTKTGIDHTDAMNRYAARRVAGLAARELCGYVLKKGSPSCGMERVKIYGSSGPVQSGRGLFAEALLRAFPHLPVEEEGRLNDPHLRENFVERVFAYRRLRSLFGGRWTSGRLVAFHTAHKLQLMAHSPRGYSELGRLVARGKGLARPALRASYEEQFMSALEVMATPKRHVNVLQHILGYFTDQLDSAARQELVELIADYGRGMLPLVVPLTLVRHYVRQFAIAYLQAQTYLEPHPKELMLRNHV